MVAYGDRMAKILGTATKAEAKSIAEDLASAPGNISAIKTAATERVMNPSNSSTVQNRAPLTNKEKMDAYLSNPTDANRKLFEETLSG